MFRQLWAFSIPLMQIKNSLQFFRTFRHCRNSLRLVFGTFQIFLNFPPFSFQLIKSTRALPKLAGVTAESGLIQQSFLELVNLQVWKNSRKIRKQIRKFWKTSNFFTMWYLSAKIFCILDCENPTMRQALTCNLQV